MIILDTDILSLLDRPLSDAATKLMSRLANTTGERICTTIVNFEEQLRGWLKQISMARRQPEVIGSYRRLHRVLDQFQTREVLGYDDAAALQFETLRRARVRIGAMDLRIAAISIANNALLISRNLRDFRLVPALRVEDWTA